jgi:CRP-like cAMP-binding protein
MVRYGGGERIFTEGELATNMYIVQSGKVRMFRIMEDEKRLLGEMEKGDFFGEMSILEGLPRTFSAEAVEDVELIEINSMTFDKMIKGNIEIAIRMLRKLSIRCRELERQIMEVHPAAGKAASQPGPSRAAKPSTAVEGGTGLRLEEESDDNPFVFAFDGPTVLVGRYDPVTEMRPDVDLTQLDLKRSVSRRHALIQDSDAGYTITEEVGALNGTAVNGDKLVTGKPHPIADGDVLSFGMVKLVFRTG